MMILFFRASKKAAFNEIGPTPNHYTGLILSNQKNMHLTLLASFYAVISLQVQVESIDWCSLDCVANTGKVEKNTMCVYKHLTSTSTCKNIRSSITPEKRKEILNLHNLYRNNFAGGQKGWPSAANMRQMSWDDTLELVALRWAEQCKPDHDDCRKTPEFEEVGQNYGMLATPNVNPDSSKGTFEGWISGWSLANTTLVFAYKPGDYGRFTQVVWATTFKLGCAQVQYSERENGIEWKRTVLVCNYGPAGNMVTARIYEDGKPCTKCPGGTKCKLSSSYPNLCALPGDAPQPIPITDRQATSGSTIRNIGPKQAYLLMFFSILTVE